MKVYEVAVAFVDNPLVDVERLVIENAFTIEISRMFVARTFLVKNDYLEFNILSDFGILPLDELYVQGVLPMHKLIFFVAILLEVRGVFKLDWGVLLFLHRLVLF
jgi:hypothetical protein